MSIKKAIVEPMLTYGAESFSIAPESGAETSLWLQKRNGFSQWMNGVSRMEHISSKEIERFTSRVSSMKNRIETRQYKMVI